MLAKPGESTHALDYCALHPAWRYVGFPDEGQLLAYSQWPRVLDIVEAAADPASSAPKPPSPPL